MKLSPLKLDLGSIDLPMAPMACPVMLGRQLVVQSEAQRCQAFWSSPRGYEASRAAGCASSHPHGFENGDGMELGVVETVARQEVGNGAADGASACPS